jgi:hypothetical protein
MRIRPNGKTFTGLGFKKSIDPYVFFVKEGINTVKNNNSGTRMVSVLVVLSMEALNVFILTKFFS